jgi:hypothetical protein
VVNTSAGSAAIRVTTKPKWIEAEANSVLHTLGSPGDPAAVGAPQEILDRAVGAQQGQAVCSALRQFGPAAESALPASRPSPQDHSRTCGQNREDENSPAMHWFPT